MEAKDTVMKYDQAKALDDRIEAEYKDEKHYWGGGWAYTYEDRQVLKSKMKWGKLEAQAETSFKAGYVEGQADKGHTEAILRVANESLKEGRREVVEFLCKEGVVGTLVETLNRINKKFGKPNGG